MASEQTPRPTEQMEPLTEAELAWLKDICGYKSKNSQAARLTLRLIASEESHRRLAGSLEAHARELAKKVCSPAQIDGYTELLTTWAATVHRQGERKGMEKAADLAKAEGDRGLGDEGPGTAYAIEAALRRAATEG